VNQRLSGAQLKRSDSARILSGQIVAAALSLLSVTLTARYVGAEVFGFSSIAIMICIFYMSLADFGACSWAARELSSHAMSDHEFKSVMQAKTKLNLVPILFTPLIFTLLPAKYSWITILCLYPLLWNNYNFVQQFLIAKGLIRESANLVIVDRVFWLLIIPLELLEIDKVLSCIIPILSGLTVHAILGNRHLCRNSKSQNSHKLINQRIIYRESRHFGFSGLFGILINLDGAIVAMTSNLANSGIYILSQRFRNPLALIFNAFSIRIRPIAARLDVSLIEKAFKDDAHILRFGVLFNLLFAISTLFGYSRLLGDEFDNLGLIICLGSLTSIPLGFSLIANSILNALGLEKFVAWLNGISSFALLIGVSVCANLGGALGAVTWVFIQSISTSMIATYKVRQELRKL